MRKRLLQITLLLAVLFGLSGCLRGNGEGYGHKCGEDSRCSEDANSPSDPPAPSRDGMYYEINPQLTCPGASVAISYRWVIYVSGDSVSLIDACTSTTTQLSVDDLGFYRGAFLGYQSAIFEKLGSLPAGPAVVEYAEAICATDGQSTSSYAEILIRNGLQLASPKASVVVWIDGLVEAQLDGSVSRNQTANQTVYQNFEIHLSIDTTPLAADPHRLAGIVSVIHNGALTSYPVLCRMQK